MLDRLCTLGLISSFLYCSIVLHVEKIGEPGDRGVVQIVILTVIFLRSTFCWFLDSSQLPARVDRLDQVPQPLQILTRGMNRAKILLTTSNIVMTLQTEKV